MTKELVVQLWALYLLFGLLIAIQVERYNMLCMQRKIMNAYNIAWYISFTMIGVLVLLWHIPRMVIYYETKTKYNRRKLKAFVLRQPVPTRRFY